MWKKMRGMLGNILPIAIAILCVGTVVVTFIVVYNDRRELIRTNQALIEQVRSTGEKPIVDSPGDVVRGEAGSPGATGPTGPRGEKGERGLMGEPGQNGATGPRGEPGAASTVPGPQGVAGAAGKDSTVPGPVGAAGANGANGSDSTVPGPQGPAGATGPQGPAGPAGAQGASVLRISCMGTTLVFYGEGDSQLGTVPNSQACATTVVPVLPPSQ